MIGGININSIITGEALIGCILGTAAGDSMGLCYEGLTPQRQRKLYKEIRKQRFFLGKGMISDDTEHSVMVAHALLISKGEPEKFGNLLGKYLKQWVLTLPLGIGFATLKACLKLVCGVKYDRSGVYSAGNGPAMRSALIGICYGDDIEQLKLLVKISTRITHTDIKAEFGALSIAIAAYMGAANRVVNPEQYLNKLKEIINDEKDNEFLEIIQKAVESAKRGESTEFFAKSCNLENGVSGYIYHTVPVVIQCWLTHQGKFEEGIIDIIKCGGDTDTTAAILGSIIGAGVYKKGIPKDWVENIVSWPYTLKYMEELAQVVYDSSTGKDSIRTFKIKSIFPAVCRNAFFMFIVIAYVLRRTMPPY